MTFKQPVYIQTGGALAGSWTGSYKKQVDWFLSKIYQVAQAVSHILRGKEVSGVYRLLFMLTYTLSYLWKKNVNTFIPIFPI